MKIGIIIPTYQRNDGKSLVFLTRALESIKNQKHNDYMIYLIGDNYENDKEFNLIANIIDKNKIKHINLSYALERNKYIINSKLLHCTGGINATNIGIEMALTDGISYVCHLDHDDYWNDSHLYEINNIIEKNNNYSIIVTSAIHYDKSILPKNITADNYYPQAGNVIRSSTCINFYKIPFRYRDVFEQTGILLTVIYGIELMCI